MQFKRHPDRFNLNKKVLYILNCVLPCVFEPQIEIKSAFFLVSWWLRFFNRDKTSERGDGSVDRRGENGGERVGRPRDLVG